MFERRHLSLTEQDLFPISFRHEINIGNIVLINRTHNPFAVGKILARNHRIYWKNYPQDFTQTSVENQAILMHELCHIWQYHTGRLTALRYLTNPHAWAYKYDFSPDKHFDDYPTEKQADLLQDWYRVNRGCDPYCYDDKCAAPTKAQINAVVPFKWS